MKNLKKTFFIPKGKTVNFLDLNITNLGTGKEYKLDDQEVYVVFLDLNLRQATERRVLHDDGVNDHTIWNGYSISLVELFPDTKLTVYKLESTSDSTGEDL